MKSFYDQRNAQCVGCIRIITIIIWASLLPPHAVWTMLQMGVVCGMASETTALVLQSCQRVLHQPNCAEMRIQGNAQIKCIILVFLG